MHLIKSLSAVTNYNSSSCLTLHEAASEWHLKNQFTWHFDLKFSHNLDWGKKITLENFLILG